VPFGQHLPRCEVLIPSLRLGGGRLFDTGTVHGNSTVACKVILRPFELDVSLSAMAGQSARLVSTLMVRSRNV
jgi:hypothetical protein